MKPDRLLAVLCLVAAACTSTGSSEDRVSEDRVSDERASQSPAERASDLVDDYGDASGWQQSFVGDLSENASAAALGYLVAVAESSDAGWSADLTGNAAAADRLALGLLVADVSFERSGADGNVLVGPQGIEELFELVRGHAGLDRVGASNRRAVARVAVGAVVDVGATSRGRLASPAIEVVAQLGALTDAVGIGVVADVETDANGRVSVWLADAASLSAIADLPVLCADNLPVVGGHGCLRSVVEPLALLGSGIEVEENWLRAATGELGPNPPLVPASIDGGVSWTNNEAQVYRPDNVLSGADGVVLRAEPAAVPSVLELPYTSGMLVSEDAFGYGTYTFDVVLPGEVGLWPAVWLLDAEACESPGRCAGYESSAYHEIDVIETSGREPDVVFTSVHWWDETIRSDGAKSVASDLTGERHVVSLQRRPGLLIWELDGVELGRVAGIVDNAAVGRVGDGPHRDAPMRLVLNLAVGGSFAGDRLVGRNGQWWGDAMVPGSFPNVGWTSADFVIQEASFTPLS